VQEGVWEHWCDFELAVLGEQAPEEVSLASEDGGQQVQGLRYR
jgi:hypothetical protein